jgi:hypothetical protein
VCQPHLRGVVRALHQRQLRQAPARATPAATATATATPAGSQRASDVVGRSLEVGGVLAERRHSHMLADISLISTEAVTEITLHFYSFHTWQIGAAMPGGGTTSRRKQSVHGCCCGRPCCRPPPSAASRMSASTFGVTRPKTLLHMLRYLHTGDQPGRGGRGTTLSPALLVRERGGTLSLSLQSGCTIRLLDGGGACRARTGPAASGQPTPPRCRRTQGR